MQSQTQRAAQSLASSIVTPPFLVAFLMLAAAAILAGPVAKRLNIKHAKLHLPLKARLAALNEKVILPYRIRERHVLEPAVVEALGTVEYLSWALEDTSVPPSDPLRHARLFITYDSGGRNLVPHRPDICYLGAGYEPAQPHENIEIVVPSLAPGSRKLPVRVCTFVQTSLRDRAKESVLYTFHCNGKFVASRTGVRVLINDLTNTYAYFSKVELSFPKATRTQCIEGSRKLFARVLPVLLAEHWPDFYAAEEAARRGAAANNQPLREKSEPEPGQE